MLASSYRSLQAKVNTVFSHYALYIPQALRQSKNELTSCLAAEKCQHEKRKTVNGEDILFAMTSLGFENYGEALKIYLSRYRDVCFRLAMNASSA